MVANPLLIDPCPPKTRVHIGSTTSSPERTYYHRCMRQFHPELEQDPKIVPKKRGSCDCGRGGIEELPEETSPQAPYADDDDGFGSCVECDTFIANESLPWSVDEEDPWDEKKKCRKYYTCMYKAGEIGDETNGQGFSHGSTRRWKAGKQGEGLPFTSAELRSYLEKHGAFPDTYR